MIGTKCYLTDFKAYDGGFVSFGDRKHRISGKGKIKTGKLDFDDVYYCKKLKYNMFSVSQMCDKKKNILFTNTECLVLSSNFKLLDESQVLLRVPRKDNIYSVDLKSVVPTRGLTCLFTKATLDESNLWHMRLRNINFITMNKLVKGNLVRDWLFDIDSLTIFMNYVPVVAGNQTNGIAGSKENLVVGQDDKKKELEQECILIPICTTDPLLSQGSKDSAVVARKKAPEVDENDTGIFGNAYDDELLEEKVDMNNVDSSYTIPEATKNKKNERGIVIKNKDRLVAQGYTHKECIDYDEVFAPVARIEAIRLFLAYASFKDFVVYQMDVKSSFLYGRIEKERIFRYLKGQPKLGLWYLKDSPFDLEAYSDSDYAGASLDTKSTTRGCQFLGKRLISWQCKKQTIVANSTTKAEYVAAANCCGQVDENVEPVIDDSEELKKCMEIVPVAGDEVLIEATPISSRSPTIIDYKIYKEGKKNYFKIIRADGNSQVYHTFEKMFKNFNREDLEVMWAIVKNKFKKEKPVDGMDNLLFRTLKTMLSIMLKIQYGNTNKD
nr:ribonuclease H-like domain-containing protein [Tanacetum cinerariifolium]